MHSSKFFVFEGIDGSGKCLGRGTPIIMANGSIRRVENIQLSDKIMGDDGKPRTVLHLYRGRDELFKITPKRGGDSYVVTGNHILCLKVASGVVAYHKFENFDGIIEMSVKEFLHQSNSFQRQVGGYHVPVNFSEQVVYIDPYFLGLWLGDGTKNRPEISKPDKEILKAVKLEAKTRGLFVRSYHKNDGTTSVTHRLSSKVGNSSNSFLDDLRYYNLCPKTHKDKTNLKHIPIEYKINSREVRLQLLAGLLDTDGYYYKGCFEIIQKQKRLARDIVFVARSLGFSVSMKSTKKYAQTGGGGIYWRIIISGFCEDIPTRILRKQAEQRKMNKDPLYSAVRIQPVGMGAYFGFELDGNGRFILGDFAVTHNSTCAQWLVSQLQEHGIPAVYTYEPTKSDVGQHIRSILKKEIPAPDHRTMAMLFATDLYMHCLDIQKWLYDGVTVVADRYIWSTLTYNCTTREEMQEVIGMHQGFYIVPDLTLLLSINPSIALERKGKRQGELFETIEYLHHVASRYTQVFTDLPFAHLTKEKCIIGVNQPLEVVQREIWEHVQPLFVSR